MYENWSRDFVTDFTDNGFDVSEEGETIKGKYNGKFVITGISRWFDDMLAKIETEHKIVKAKSFFNNRTKNVLVSMDQVSKLLELIISDKIIIGYLHRDSKYKYSDLPDDRVSQNFNLYIDAIKSLVK